MTITAPVSLAAAADLLAIYGIIEVPRQPALSKSILAAAGATMAALLLGLLTGWSLPPLATLAAPPMQPDFLPM